MSTPDEPPKPKPPATMAWTPEDLEKARAEEEARPAAAEPTPAGEPEEDPLVGQLLRNKWRVLKRIGAGGFGTVYKVRDEKGGWIEALKILGVDRITGAEAENARKRFLREAQIMKRLGTESKHIVGLSSYEEDLEAGLIYFLMEFVEGKPLADVVLEEGPQPVERVVSLALQACEALIVAHEGPDGVVHRDLKLENFMLTRDRAGQEVLKVLDFGIAKLAEKEADSRLTTVGTLGTPGYAAPEQLRAEAVDGRTDLFAFGVVLYALLTGKDPWLGGKAGEPTTEIYQLMVATDRGEVIPMADTGVSVPPAMEALVLKLLRREPEQRYQSARELRDALLRVQAGGVDADAASLRVLTEPAGVRVEIRHGRKTVAEGPTPCLANGLAAGSYRVTVRDERFHPLETVVALDPGAMEDVTLAVTPRSAAAPARSGGGRRPLVAAAGVVLVAGLAAVAFLQPWGRTLDLEGLIARSASGGVAWAQIDPSGVSGTLSVGPLRTPFRVPIADAELPGALVRLREAGVAVDPSREVVRIVELARAAQARGAYFGEPGSDVRSHAERLEAVAPGSPEARSLLLKVGERLAWDADAARQEGEEARARELLDACRALVPAHPRCTAAAGGA